MESVEPPPWLTSKIIANLATKTPFYKNFIEFYKKIPVTVYALLAITFIGYGISNLIIKDEPQVIDTKKSKPSEIKEEKPSESLKKEPIEVKEKPLKKEIITKSIENKEVRRSEEKIIRSEKVQDKVSEKVQIKRDEMKIKDIAQESPLPASAPPVNYEMSDMESKKDKSISSSKKLNKASSIENSIVLSNIKNIDQLENTITKSRAQIIKKEDRSILIKISKENFQKLFKNLDLIATVSLTYRESQKDTIIVSITW